MQHLLAKSPISAREIGDFVACGRVIEREGGSRPPPSHIPYQGICAYFRFVPFCNRPLLSGQFPFMQLTGRDFQAIIEKNYFSGGYPWKTRNCCKRKKTSSP